jgi:DNA end-binding protein Ku
MLQPRGKGLMATALRYNTEVRDEKSYFSEIPDVKVPSDMLDLAMHILKSKKSHFDPQKFEDRYEGALLDLIKAKQAGKPAPKAPEARPGNVINLMDALRRSVKAEVAGRKGAGAPRGSASRRSSRAAVRRAG